MVCLKFTFLFAQSGKPTKWGDLPRLPAAECVNGHALRPLTWPPCPSPPEDGSWSPCQPPPAIRSHGAWAGPHRCETPSDPASACPTLLGASRGSQPCAEAARPWVLWSSPARLPSLLPHFMWPVVPQPPSPNLDIEPQGSFLQLHVSLPSDDSQLLTFLLLAMYLFYCGKIYIYIYPKIYHFNYF